jgi:AraC-like DNA-binding protein
MSTTLPLERHVLFHSADLDETREHVARVFCDHRLSLGPGERQIDARQHVARLGDVTLTYLDYGGAVDIDPGPLDSFYLVQMPLAGRAAVRCGGEEIVSTAALASVPDPDRPLAMRWEAGTPHVIVRFEREALERRASALTGRRIEGGLGFALGFDVGGAAGARWRAALQLALAEIDAADSATNGSLGAGPLQDLLSTLLLYALPGAQSDALRTPVAASGDRAVRAAVAFAHAHATEPIDLAAIAEAAGVGVRALQAGFRRSLGTTPLAYLRDYRLDLARQALATGREPVTQVAFRLGFAHLGRFSAVYRERFGESPSVTRSRAARS